MRTLTRVIARNETNERHGEERSHLYSGRSIVQELILKANAIKKEKQIDKGEVLQGINLYSLEMASFLAMTDFIKTPFVIQNILNQGDSVLCDKRYNKN